MSIEATTLEKHISEVTGIPLYGESESPAIRPLESFRDRVWRHLKERQFGYSTLKRGFKQLKGLTMARDLIVSLDHMEIEEDYSGIPGLTKADYAYKLSWKTSKNPLSTRLIGNRIIHLYCFPEEARFRVYATPPDERISSQEFFEQTMRNSENIIAFFTGPTFVGSEGLPNNGFYLKDYPKTVEFRDTNPSGERRGAFATSQTGELVVINDATKWNLIQARLPGLQALIGGAGYMTSYDSALPEESHTGHISFLFQYQDKDGKLHTGFAFTEDYTDRSSMQRSLIDFTARMHGRSFIALEMEYAGSGCLIRGEKNLFSFGYNDRFDHYLVTL